MVVSDAGIFASTSHVKRKAGAGVAAAVGTTACNDYLTQAESLINATCKYNFSDNYSTLNVDTKGVLKEIASDLAGIYAVTYDMSGYNSRIEAEDVINVLRDAALRGLDLLRDKKTSDFIREVA